MPKSKLYKAEYADEEMEVFYCNRGDDEALQEAFWMEDKHGTLFNLCELDEDYNSVRNVW